MSAWWSRLCRVGSAPARPRGRGERFALETLEERLVLSAGPIDIDVLPGSGSAWNYVPDGALNGGTLMADVTGDGREEILAIGGDGNIHAYAFNTGSGGVDLIRSYSQTGTPTPIQATPVVTEIPGVGKALFAAASDGRVFGWNVSSAALLGGWPATVDLQASDHPLHYLRNNVYGGIAAGDLTGDGNPEIVVGSINHELTAFDASGNILWRFNNDDTIIGAPAIGDIDRDGLMDVVYGGDSTTAEFYDDGGRVVALTHEGKRKWVHKLEQVAQSSVALADIDDDGYLETIVGTGFNFDDPAKRGNKVLALDHRGAAKPGWPFVTNPDNSVVAGTFSSPAIADVNGDGTLETVIADGQGFIHAIRPNGTALWSTNFFPPNPLRFVTSPIVADVDSDGVLDVVIANSSRIGALRGDTGAKIDFAIGGFPGDVDNYFFTDPDQNETFHSPLAVGRLKGDATWQFVAVSNLISSQGQILSPSKLYTFDLGATTAAPAWRMFRRDAGSNPLVRSASHLTTTITALYQQALGRTPGAGEISGQLAAHRHARSLTPLYDGILGSVEAQNRFIAGWYADYLDRGAAPAELANWRNFLAATGGSHGLSLTFIVGSDEAFHLAGGTNRLWVTYMYQRLLDRDPSQSESDNFTNQLNNGTLLRTDLTFIFLFSQELTENRVRSFYADYRPGGMPVPAADDLRAAGWDLRRQGSDREALRRVLDTQGNFTDAHTESLFVANLYKDVLGRPASAGEVAGWLAALENGSSFGDVSVAVVASLEVRIKLVNGYYRTFLDRAPTPAERQGVLNQLAAGTPRAQVIRQLTGSGEYFVHAGNTNLLFIRSVFRDVLGRASSAGDEQTWLNQASNGVNIRKVLPTALTTSDEYYRRVIDRFFFTYLRRLSSTPADEGVLVVAGTPYGGQAQLNYLKNGGSEELLESLLLTSAEYFQLVRSHGLWLGTRWKGVPT